MKIFLKKKLLSERNIIRGISALFNSNTRMKLIEKKKNLNLMISKRTNSISNNDTKTDKRGNQNEHRRKPCAGAGKNRAGGEGLRAGARGCFAGRRDEDERRRTREGGHRRGTALLRGKPRAGAFGEKRRGRLRGRAAPLHRHAAEEQGQISRGTRVPHPQRGQRGAHAGDRPSGGKARSHTGYSAGNQHRGRGLQIRLPARGAARRAGKSGRNPGDSGPRTHDRAPDLPRARGESPIFPPFATAFY